MTELRSTQQTLGVDGFLFSPASCYPKPKAYVIDKSGAIVHTWSHSAHQPDVASEPPSYLRGWNHVEVDRDGCLFATVPLRALLKLTPQSELAWACDVAAHHDLAIEDTGVVRVLSEAPRRVITGSGAYTLLDNLVVSIDAQGRVTDEISLYDVLRTETSLRRLIDDAVMRRHDEFRRRSWPSPDDQISSEVLEETREILETARDIGDRRRTLQRLRDLPGSPCDALHTNTIHLLEAHPAGIWRRGDALVCMRELNLVAAIDLVRRQVRWHWGPGEVSGPHQPSMRPDGSVLLFDNGAKALRTRLVVVEPRTGEVIWSWSADPPESFFCPLAGGCERLPNGNLLVTNSTAGGAFELTMTGAVVWQTLLSSDVYGPERGRVSIYRMSAVAPGVVAQLQRSKQGHHR